MSVICPNCGKQYDITLFEFNRTVLCDCGRSVQAGHDMRLTRKPSRVESRARARLRAFQREADRVSSMVLASDLPDVDVEIAISNLRERCLELYPDEEDLFDRIYESRFRRLWAQFREEGD